MKQLIQSYRSGEIWLADVPAPLERDGGLVVRTASSLVSAGTERMIMELAKKSLIGKARARPDLVKKVLGKIRTEGLGTTLTKVFAKLDTPVPLGYSCAGTVEEVGSTNGRVSPGDRVACAGAGYATHAEYNYVPFNLCAKVPENVSLEDASFTTLGAIAMQGVRQASVTLGERVVVVGLGLLGLLTVQILKAAGCQVLGSDPDAKRCELARSLGADEAVFENLTDVAAAFTKGFGADAVIITAATASNGPIETAAEISRQKGRVVIVGVVGMDVPRDPFYKKELDLRLSMSYGPGRYDPSYEEGGRDYPFGYVRWTAQRNMESFLEMVAAGKVTPAKLITHRWSIDDALAAYELLETGSEPYIGIVIGYPDDGTSPEKRSRTSIQIGSDGDNARLQRSAGAIGVGFIGAGSFAKGVLLPSLKKVPTVNYVGICAATGISASQTATKNGFSFATTDYEQLLADERIHAVFIATRHNSHARLAIAALKAKKHVFVEKPLCMKEGDLKSIEEVLAADAGAHRLMVGYNRRFSPHAAALQKEFAGRTSPMVINYRVSAGFIPKDVWVQDPEIGGGRIVGEMCHFIDLCEFLTGSVPVSVQAESIESNDDRIVAQDTTSVLIRYHDGSLATVQYYAVGSPAVGKERIEVYADGTTGVLEDFTRTTFFGSDHKPLKTRQDKGFDAELSRFMGSLNPEAEPPITINSILRTSRVTFAILESLRCRSRVLL